jgi:CHAT domain-containing protein
VPPRDGSGEIWIRPDSGSAAECGAVAGFGAGTVADSSATGFLESLNTADVLHLAVAAHEKPAFLLFDTGSGNLVPAEDIARASATCRLVVLSRFPAELGTRVRGGGLVEALLRAGVRSVLLPLWPLSTDVTEFVLEFHRLLREGHAPSAALARSQVGEATWDRAAFALVSVP